MERKLPTLQCPLPLYQTHIVMAHGGGGRMMHDLIDSILAPVAIDNVIRHDGAVVNCQAGRLVFTTDTFVARPRFFPGGDIGSLAVCGTINDLAMCGARPDVLSVGIVLEEGFPIDDLHRIAKSMRQTAKETGVRIVTGDTKVVERGHGDGIYINTSGIGWIRENIRIEPSQVRPGDVIILSGDLGRHGIAMMAAREGLEFETRIESDCAPLHEPVLGLIDAGIDIHCLRDLTRGGLASAVCEIADDSGRRLQIDERSIPVSDEVRGACEVLGLDPLAIANEGRFCLFVPAEQLQEVLSILHEHPVTANARTIGVVLEDADAGVTLRTLLGTERVLLMPSGDILPRIC